MTCRRTSGATIFGHTNHTNRDAYIKVSATLPGYRPLPSRTGQHVGWRAVLALLALCLLASSGAHAVKAEDLLPPEQAYAFSARSLAADMVRAEWRIADGYYLYRDKLRFETAPGGIGLGDTLLPPPTETKTDEFFGEMAIYRGTLTVDIPLLRGRDDPAKQLTLLAHSQGCADAGVCFPPQTQTATLQLISAPPAAEGANGSGLRGLLSSFTSKLGLGAKPNEFLDPEQAFVLTLDAEADRAVARWRIAEGYYLYRKQFAFALRDADGVSLGEARFPPGVDKVDESFGHSEVYYDEAAIELPLSRSGGGAAQAVTLEVRYQGCADAGLCYPPITKNLPLSLPAAGGAVAAAAPGNNAGGFVSEQDRYALSLQDGNRFLTLLSFFGVGILLAFTPCVFPMLPILSTLIVGQGAAVTTRKAFSLSLAYVLAMAVTYTAAGVLAGLFGANLQAAFQNPWIIGSFSALFVVLALSMFGFYNLQLPASLQTKLSELSNQQKGGTLIGAAVMGLLSALIVGPCVAAPLAGALIYIGQTGDAVLGGLALFAMSMGMGAPLLAVGTSAGKWLPKISGWMNTIKAVFGVMLLALAIWMLERILPGPLSLVLWGVLFIVSAVYMGAFDRLLPDATGWRKLWKGSGLVFMLYGALLLVGAAGGGSDMLQPLRGASFAASSAGAGQSHGLRFTRVKGLDGLQQALRSAEGKTVMLDFYADWCVSCKEMERDTFSDAKVQAALSGTVLLQADVTANDAADQTLLKHFGLFGPPSIIFFDGNGAERRPYRLVGYLAPDAFAQHVQLALNGR